MTQKALVHPDSTFSHNIILNEEFLDGKYTVKTQYGNSKATIEIISFVVNSDDVPSIEQESSPIAEIPDWVKSNAGWWADGTLDDNSFVTGIQFLITEGLMEI